MSNTVSHQIQIHLWEMGLHQPQGVLHGISGCSLDEGLQSARGCLQPLRQVLSRGHVLQLERSKQSVQLPAQAIQHRPGLGHLTLHFYRKVLGCISLSDKNSTHPTAV